MSKTIAIIPARLGSSRLRNKPLLMFGGRTLLEWTYIQARAAEVDNVLVTSPDKAVCEKCRDLGIPWFPSSIDCQSGTHRCLEVYDRMRGTSKDDIVINWQCDEPLLHSTYVDQAIKRIKSDYDKSIHTFVSNLTGDGLDNPDVVKVAVRMRDSWTASCFWFTRAPIARPLVHCGVYVFPAKELYKYGSEDLSDNARAESLEQLTWIENGAVIRALLLPMPPLSINSPEDAINFVCVLQGAPDAN